MRNEEEAKQLYIPEKLAVGFQKRDGTYNGMLAYVIYYDKAGVLRKEKSWQSWRDNKIKPQEIENKPTEGFVLNKKVGGYKSHWNFRDAHVRVYDPRGFEFEISVPNLLFILREGACSPGKGLEGSFVYAWEGTELVLLPTHSVDFKNSQNFTDLQGKQVSAKELKEGVTYLTKKQEELTYLGKFDYHFQYNVNRNVNRNYYYGQNYYGRHSNVDTVTEYNHPPKKDQKGVIKKFVFWNGKDFVFQNDIKNIATAKDEAVHPDFAELVDKYNKSPHGSKVVRLFLKEVAEKKKKEDYYGGTEDWFFEDKDGTFVECTTRNKRDIIESIQAQARWYIDEKTGLLTRKDYQAIAYAPGEGKQQGEYDHRTGKRSDANNTMEWREPTQLRLFGETENGGKHRVVGPSYKDAFEKEK